MKINLNSGNGYMEPDKQKPTANAGGGFIHTLDSFRNAGMGAADSNKYEQAPGKPLHCDLRRSHAIAKPAISQASGEDMKCLVKEAFYLNTNQIKQEIDSICACETGENIDLALLTEWMNLYEEVKLMEDEK